MQIYIYIYIYVICETTVTNHVFLKIHRVSKNKGTPKSSKIGAFLYSNKHGDLGTPRDLRNPRIAHYKTYPCSMPLKSIKSPFLHGEFPIKVFPWRKRENDIRNYTKLYHIYSEL